MTLTGFVCARFSLGMQAKIRIGPVSVLPRSGVLTAHACITVPSAENPELSKGLSFKCEVGQIIALHASPAATNSVFFFLKFIQLQFQLRSPHFCLRELLRPFSPETKWVILLIVNI